MLSVTKQGPGGRINVPRELMRILRLDNCRNVAAEVLDIDMHERVLVLRLVCRDQGQE